MDSTPEFLPELDARLTEHIRTSYISEGRLFGAVPQSELNTDERRRLQKAGWLEKNYEDNPVMVPPQQTIDWDKLGSRHRDRTLHAISHRLPEGAPWAGTRQAILEEILSSRWEEQEEQLRVVLHSFAFASIWSSLEDRSRTRIEGSEIFFFYTARMLESAQKALELATKAPEPEDEFWNMVQSLN